MKREEKNQQMRRRIMDGALAEFSRQGYGASSINTICASQELSKGIVYHYFKTKDDLYLACVEECFDRLTDYLRTQSQAEQGSTGERLERYFTARLVFFREHPVYQRIFCEVVMTPPAHLKAELRQRTQPFDASGSGQWEFEAHEAMCRQALHILLYGIIAREAEHQG